MWRQSENLIAADLVCLENWQGHPAYVSADQSMSTAVRSGPPATIHGRPSAFHRNPRFWGCFWGYLGEKA